MNALVDTSVFCGMWPFRCLSHRTPGALKEYLARAGVSQAWVAASEAILYPDPMQANEPLFEAVGNDPFYRPVALLDLALATWEADAQACLERWGCRAFKLTPRYHSYELADERVDALVSRAEAAGVPVCIQMRMQDERTHHPLMKVPEVGAEAVVELAKRRPRARFLACAAYKTDLEILKQAPNVWVEISFVESGQPLRNAIGAIGAERLVFGSHSPFYYVEAVAAKLDVDEADVPRDQVRAIAAINARQLLGSD